MKRLMNFEDPINEIRAPPAEIHGLPAAQNIDLNRPASFQHSALEARFAKLEIGRWWGPPYHITGQLTAGRIDRRFDPQQNRFVTPDIMKHDMANSAWLSTDVRIQDDRDTIPLADLLYNQRTNPQQGGV